jgi:chromosome segregation protein
MTHIKRLVLKGFKSFPKKTEIQFDEHINVILGPNGSGKSNISDALCFVLGRLSIKSMRAAKASNLIFMGTKHIGPAKEASVGLVFDNTDGTFPISKDELIIERIVRSNGQSIYKCNHETKTRQEILEVLAQAGIDPYGFNIVLQGEIQNIVRMNSEDRRKIIEEVAGISIYEVRKEKTIRELEKTDEKLKEVNAVLRERTAYLNNLERERQQALKFKHLQELERRCKSSVLDYDIGQKEREIKALESQIAEKKSDIEKLKANAKEIQTKIQTFELQISRINSLIQQATGIEQEALNREISDLRATLAGFRVRKESYEKRLKEISQRSEDLNKIIDAASEKISSMERKSPALEKKDKEIANKRKSLEELEKERKRYYILKSDARSIQAKIEDRKILLNSHASDIQILLKQIDLLHNELYDKEIGKNEYKLNLARELYDEKKAHLEELAKEERDIERQIVQAEFEQQRLKKIKAEIEKLDICPLCKSVITEEHLKKIDAEIEPQLNELKKSIEQNQAQHSKINIKKSELSSAIDGLSAEIIKREADVIKILTINDKSQQIKKMQEQFDSLKKDISEAEKKQVALDKQKEELATIEERYERARIDMQELAMQNAENIDAELSFKKRELERHHALLKQFAGDKDGIYEELSVLEDSISQHEEILERKIVEEEELSRKFKKLFAERDSIQDEIHQHESENAKKQREFYQHEQHLNEMKIVKARLSAEMENLQIERKAYPSDIEHVKGSRESLIEKISNVQNQINSIGSVNLRALEVYEMVKQEYDSVNERMQILQKEKEKILAVIHEIDVKKKKTFLKTLEAVNGLFSRNFTQLSAKGEVMLELEDRKDPFAGGLNVLVKVGKGKYFDVTSLSGGEQTLVALSLIFAVQEYKPYAFYILDEIDAALDKRNSQRLGNLLRKYMASGQYIMITHNDEIILQASTLYGLSMHEGISKVISMRLENPELTNAQIANIPQNIAEIQDQAKNSYLKEDAL